MQEETDLLYRGIAQFGRARALGARGLGFESLYPDQGRKIVCREISEQPIILIAPPRQGGTHESELQRGYGLFKPMQLVA